MRILVTGTTGQVGAAVARRFDAFATVIRADRAMLDLTAAPDRIAAALTRARPDIIINPAAYTAVDRAEDEPALAHQVNAVAPGIIARWAAAHRVPLVHVSTDYVFDGSGTTPWREDDPTGPVNVYGASKRAGEEAVAEAGGAHLIVRTSWVYAATGNNFFRTIARLAREREELRVVDDQIGSPTSAAFIADALAGMFRNRSDLPQAFTAARHVVHLAAGGETNWHAFAEAIVTGLISRGVPVTAQRVVPIPTAEYPTKARRPLNSRLDLTRLRGVFGVEPQPWQALLATELDSLLAQP